MNDQANGTVPGDRSTSFDQVQPIDYRRYPSSWEGFSAVERRMMEVRFLPVSRKSNERGDSFLSLWLTLRFFNQSGSMRNRVRRAARFLSDFWKAAAIGEVLREAGDQAESLLYQHIYGAALRYEESCRDDPGFGSKFLGFSRMTPDQISSKAASITYVELIDLLLLVSDDVPYRDLMVHALHRAYMRAFAEHPVDISEWQNGLKPEAQERFERIMQMNFS